MTIGIATLRRHRPCRSCLAFRRSKAQGFSVQKLLPDGKGPIYRNVTKEYAPQIAKAKGKTFAAAGEEGVAVESSKHTNQNVGVVEFFYPENATIEKIGQFQR